MFCLKLNRKINTKEEVKYCLNEECDLWKQCVDFTYPIQNESTHLLKCHKKFYLGFAKLVFLSEGGEQILSNDIDLYGYDIESMTVDDLIQELSKLPKGSTIKLPTDIDIHIYSEKNVYDWEYTLWIETEE